MSNPFADPESMLRYGMRVKDVKERVSPRGPPGQPPATPPTAPPISGVSGRFSVQELSDRIVVGPVMVYNELYRVSVWKTRLDGDNKRSQDDWLTYLKNRPEQLASGPMQLGLLAALHQEREGQYKEPIERMRLMLRPDYDASIEPGVRVATSTRVLYANKSQNIDRVIHEYHLPGAFPKEVTLFGPDGQLVPGCGYEAASEALTSIKDLARLGQITQWLTGKNPWLYRMNSHTEKEQQRALVLGGGDGFDVGAGNGIDGGRPARGWQWQKISTGTGGSR